MEDDVSAPALNRIVELTASERVFLRSLLGLRWEELDRERMAVRFDSEDYDLLLERQRLIEGIQAKLR